MPSVKWGATRQTKRLTNPTTHLIVVDDEEEYVYHSIDNPDVVAIFATRVR